MRKRSKLPLVVTGEIAVRRPASNLLSRNYGHVGKDILTPVLELFAAARTAFDGDVERAVVLLEVALRTLQDPRLADVDLETLLSGSLGPYYPSLSTNMRSIADSSGIPKETVRRKVAALVADGLVLREGNALSLSPAASPVLTPIRE